MTALGTMRCVSFVTIRRGASVLLIQDAFRSEPLERALLEGEEALRSQYASTQVKSAASSRVYRMAIPGPDGEVSVYFKEYLDRSAWDAIKHMVRVSRARRAFRASLMLMEQGIQAPDVVAMGEVRSRLGTKRSFLLTRDVPASVRVSDYLVAHAHYGTVDVLRCRRDLIRTLGQTVGHMHRRGVVHGDLRLGNVLARRVDNGWELFFLDNERTRRFPWLPFPLRLKNLVQANMLSQGVTTTDRLRFFRAYLSACPGLRRHARRWARRVQARTLQRQRR